MGDMAPLAFSLATLLRWSVITINYNSNTRIIEKNSHNLSIILSISMYNKIL